MKTLTQLFNNNELEQLAHQLFTYHNILDDNRWEDDVSYYRKSKFYIDDMYYTVSYCNGKLISISKG